MVMRLPRRLRPEEREGRHDNQTGSGPRLVGDPGNILEWPGLESAPPTTALRTRTARAEIRVKRFSGISKADLIEFTGQVTTSPGSPADLLKELVDVVTKDGGLSESIAPDQSFILEVRLSS